MAERGIWLEVEVAAARDAVWEAWATSEGAKTFFAPDARIEAHAGGAYELYFVLGAPEGSRGSEGCKVISLSPGQRLVVTWNFPPTIPSIRDEHTRWALTLEPIGDDHTLVRLNHYGWKEGPDWDEGFAYFERAWGLVLGRLQRRFTQGPIDWDNPGD